MALLTRTVINNAFKKRTFEVKNSRKDYFGNEQKHKICKA